MRSTVLPELRTDMAGSSRLPLEGKFVFALCSWPTTECDLRLRGKAAVVSFLPELLLGQNLANQHLALGLVMNVAGAPEPLHGPIAALDSRRNNDFPTLEVALVRGQVHSTNTSRRIISKSMPPPIYI
jgi:hypothetical protein